MCPKDVDKILAFADLPVWELSAKFCNAMGVARLPQDLQKGNMTLNSRNFNHVVFVSAFIVMTSYLFQKQKCHGQISRSGHDVMNITNNGFAIPVIVVRLEGLLVELSKTKLSIASALIES